MTDLSREVRGRFEREVSIETSVADMTPVSSGGVSACVSHGALIRGRHRRVGRNSQPNSSPLIPAETTSIHTKSPGLPSAILPTSAPPLVPSSSRWMSGASCVSDMLPAAVFAALLC